MAIGRIPEPGTGIPESIVNAKGDLIAGTADNTVARLAVGTNGHTLVANSATATGLEWVAPAGGGGKVLQVVQGTTSTTVSTTGSATFFDTNLTASITPSSATSKVLILVSQTLRMLGNFYTGYQLLRGTTVIYGPNSVHGPTNGTFGNVFDESTTIVYLDSPATTSSTTYKTQFQQTDGVTTSQSRSFSTIVLLEIGA